MKNSWNINLNFVSIFLVSNELGEFEIFVTAYIIGGQSKDLGSNPSAVESVFFPQKDFSNSLNIFSLPISTDLFKYRMFTS